MRQCVIPESTQLTNTTKTCDFFSARSMRLPSRSGDDFGAIVILCLGLFPLNLYLRAIVPKASALFFP